MARLFLLFLAAFLLDGARAWALTGDEVLQKFQSRVYMTKTMSGAITWMHQSGEGYTGTFKYMAPGRIYLKFSSPSGRVICSNGKRLWVFDSASNICGVQDLSKGGSGGLSGLVRGYLAILTSQGPSGYTLKLKSNEKNYSDITLVIDPSYNLKKAVFATRDGNGFSVTLSNVRTGENMTPGMFDFSAPSSAQVVRNPLDVR